MWRRAHNKPPFPRLKHLALHTRRATLHIHKAGLIMSYLLYYILLCRQLFFFAMIAFASPFLRISSFKKSEFLRIGKKKSETCLNRKWDSSSHFVEEGWWIRFFFTHGWVNNKNDILILAACWALTLWCAVNIFMTSPSYFYGSFFFHNKSRKQKKKSMELTEQPICIKGSMRKDKQGAKRRILSSDPLLPGSPTVHQAQHHFRTGAKERHRRRN